MFHQISADLSRSWQIPPDLHIFHQISADLSRSWQILVDLDGSWQILADMCRSIKIFINLQRYWLIVIILLISWLLNLSQAAVLHHRLQPSSTWSEGWQHQGWFLDLIAVAVTHNYYIETLIFMLDLVKIHPCWNFCPFRMLSTAEVWKMALED